MPLKKYRTSLRNIQSDDNNSHRFHSIQVVSAAANKQTKQNIKVIQSGQEDEIGTGTSSFNLNFAPIYDLAEFVHLFHPLRNKK